MTKEQIKNRLAELKNEAQPLEEELRNIIAAEGREVEAKVKRCRRMEDKFNEDELVYAAVARCQCGAGYAYPEKIGVRGEWTCSAILTGKAELGSTHDGHLPFAFYELKSEGQPSANGATTRPIKEE